MNFLSSSWTLRRSGSLALLGALTFLAGCGGGGGGSSSGGGGGGTGGGGGGGGTNARTVVFVSDRDGNLEIYRMSSDGTSQVRLTTSAAADLNPSVNRAGTAMVFSSERDGNREIYKLTFGTNLLQRFTEDPAPGVQDRSPVFSPDGTRIAWVSGRGGVPNLFVMDATGENQVQVGAGSVGNSDVTWGPGGTEIAYVAAGAIAIRNVSTGVERRIALDTTGVSDLRWSPDGSRFLFTQTTTANGATTNEIRVVDATTGAPVVSGTGTGELRFSAGTQNVQPSWSPNGSSVVWAARTLGSATPAFQVFSQSVAQGTTTPTPLTALGANTEPAWAE